MNNIEAKYRDGLKIWDDRTTTTHLVDRTGIQMTEYAVCEDGCYCFASTPHYTHCPVDGCGKVRPVNYAGELHVAVARQKFHYLQIIHRLRLWFTDSRRIQTMRGYRIRANRRW
jgi:hypothetical protein